MLTAEQKLARLGAAYAWNKKKEEVLAQCADIVRQYYPNPPVL